MEKPVLNEKSKVPAPRSVPAFSEANPGGSGEKRVLPPSASKLDENFVGKLKPIESDLPVRQKHRRRRGADELRVADWDTLALTEIPEAEMRADEWTAPGPDLLNPESLVPKILRATAEPVTVVETEEGLVVERKRIRKGKRKVFFGQVLLQRLTVSGRYLLFGLLLLIGSAGAWFLAQTFRAKAKVSASEPSPIKATAVSLAERTAQLTGDDLAQSYELVSKYLAADGWEAKSAFVRRPEKVKPLMEKWYITHPSGPLSCEEPDNFKKSLIGKTYFVFLAMRTGPEKVQRFFTVEHIPPADGKGKSTYLLDWETSVGYQPIELRDYMVKQPLEPYTFRVLVKPEAYYNYAFSDSEKWISFDLSYPGDDDFRLHGYVEKGSDLEEELGKQLLLEANIILQLRYPKNPVSREQVLIEKIIHPSWFYDREDVALPSQSGKAAEATTKP